MLNREVITDALRFWETARIPYNLILLVVTAGAALLAAHECPECNLPQAIGLHLIDDMFVWVVVANVAYCFAYVPDIFVQLSDFRSSRPLWRSVLWLGGTAFASVLAWSMASLMFYPY